MTGAHWVRRAAGSPPGNSPRRARRAHQTAHPAGAFITATPAGPSAAAGRARSRLARQSQDRQCARAARASPDRQATHHARTVAAASNASLGRADQAVLYASPPAWAPACVDCDRQQSRSDCRLSRASARQGVAEDRSGWRCGRNPQASVRCPVQSAMRESSPGGCYGRPSRASPPACGVPYEAPVRDVSSERIPRQVRPVILFAVIDAQ